MALLGHNRRLPGLVDDVPAGIAGAERRPNSAYGRPRLVLDWSPRGNNVDYDGSWAGTNVVIDGLTTKIFNRVSDGGASSTSLLRATSAGLVITHTGGSGQATSLEWDLTPYKGISETFNHRCVSMSFDITALDNASANFSMVLYQTGGDEPLPDRTDMDIQNQTFRQNSSSWRVRAFDWTGTGSKSIHNYPNAGLGSSRPANVRSMIYGGPYQWWVASDTGTGPCAFQGVSAQRRIICNNSVTAHDNSGLSHDFLAWQIGIADTTASTVTLTNMRVWTYGGL